MALHLLHGSTTEWNSRLQSCRNFVPQDKLRKYLEEQPRKYMNFEDDLENPHVLTVDDSTRGAADACMLAKMLGHEVTLFVNPFHIATCAPYFFTLFDEVLDARSINRIEFERVIYNLNNKKELRAFRLAAKQMFCSLDYEHAISLVNELREILGVQTIEVHEHAQILQMEDLIHLRDIGVKIENHGWYHDEIAHQSNQEFLIHIQKASKWLTSTLNISPKEYAVPFGLTFLNKQRRNLISGPVWLAHPDLPEGNVGLGHWNRSEITPMLQNID